MDLTVFNGSFYTYKVKDLDGVDFSAPFVFVAKTDRELSVVCQTPPAHPTAREGPFAALRVEGILDFSLTGILAKLTEALAKAGIPVFALSTFDTDYLLVRENTLAAAKQALEQAGYRFV